MLTRAKEDRPPLLSPAKTYISHEPKIQDTNVCNCPPTVLFSKETLGRHDEAQHAYSRQETEDSRQFFPPTSVYSN